ncbi:WSC domain-containing protein [Rutstroemia sp. NJR-2017a WRK4]|nr:WSC domain-containing protein [Rutstroemia sp. NJR-2017a WRK4]
MAKPLVYLLLLTVAALTQAAFFYPDAVSSEIEHILVDTHGAYASGFADAITPCSNYVSGAQTFGRETAAQWLRVAFHDFVTARVNEGTGGIDASIGFETLREEDSGSAFNDSFAFFRPYVNARVSMADIVALSVSMSVGNCGGPQIPVRGGRIDATGMGEEGVPAPETSLEQTLEFFANAGFNQVDSIGLTACGHTMGSVHHGGFPTVVGPEAVTPSNTAGGIHFDSSVDVFDMKVVHEYIDGTGNQGGPLVTSFNESSRSDLRLYESDGNATMHQLYEQEESFLNTCVPLMQRMVETVPKEVVLSDIISPMAVKPVNATFDFASDGSLVFKGYIRVLAPVGSTPPKTITLNPSSHSTITLSAESATGTNVFGTTAFFPFSFAVGNPSSLKSFTITASSTTSKFTIPYSSTFVVPTLSSSSSSSSTKVNVTIAQQPSYSTPKVSVKAPIPQQGTLGPAIGSYDVSNLKSIGTKAGLKLWEGSVDLGVLATGSVGVEVLDSKGAVLDLLFL